jgi:glycosyltransferase involved in cell wall biosynthesis
MAVCGDSAEMSTIEVGAAPEGIRARDPSQRKKVLLCCDSPPFPPRNGVTIPPAGYVTLLREAGHTVDCLLLSESGEGHGAFMADTRASVDDLFLVERRRMNTLQRAGGEVLGLRPAFAACTYSIERTSQPCKFADYDVILATPISALPYALAHRVRGQRVVGAISDCYTSVLSNEARTESKLARRIVTRLRTAQMARMESRLLTHCEIVLVQTEVDREWLRRIGGDSLFERSVAIPNGVVALSTGVADQPVTPTALIIANFSDPLYRANLMWFYDQVWPLVLAQRRDARLRVVGRGLEMSPLLQERLQSDSSVDLRGFVRSLADAYRGATVVVAPIFKKHGFINKVAEAYSAGVPVVGDTSAFNGLAESLRAGCGVAKDSPEEFAAAVLEYLCNEHSWRTAATAAWKFARATLSWDSRREALLHAVFGVSVDA